MLVRTCNIKKLLFKSAGQRDNRPSLPEPYYIPTDKNDKTLVFESRFECGNLQLVHKQSDSEYNLVLQNDINSKGHTQWFFFRVQNTRAGQKVKFNLLNFVKPNSLFNQGMKPLIYSEMAYEEKETGWFRDGDNIGYFANTQFYTLTFQYTFKYDNDNVYFAYSRPYSYSDLIEDVSTLERKAGDFLSRNTLCRTLAGNKCEYLTITSREKPENGAQKKGVFISSRVHPGEANGSWMMKGVLEFLTGTSPEAQLLRKNFVFKIIPMLNPDGVINGNYRCSLLGCDLNRRWKNPSKILHPTVYHAKHLLKEFARERECILFCDLHGHSRRKNVFMYGNTNSLSEYPEESRIFPFIMAKVCPYFSFPHCRFSVQKSKESTARITMWRDLRR